MDPEPTTRDWAATSAANYGPFDHLYLDEMIKSAALRVGALETLKRPPLLISQLIERFGSRLNRGNHDT